MYSEFCFFINYLFTYFLSTDLITLVYTKFQVKVHHTYGFSEKVQFQHQRRSFKTAASHSLAVSDYVGHTTA